MHREDERPEDGPVVALRGGMSLGSQCDPERLSRVELADTLGPEAHLLAVAQRADFFGQAKRVGDPREVLGSSRGRFSRSRR